MGTNILQDVQDYVAGKLSADSYLSGMCTFLAENRKDLEYEIKNALSRQGIVGLCMTPKATYAGKYEDLFLAWTLEELEIDIVENPLVNRGKKSGFITGQDAAMRVFDVLCPLSGDLEGQFNPVSVEEGEDNGLLVNKCILKALVYGEHGDVPQPDKPITYQFVKLLSEPPPLSVQPHEGWMWEEDGNMVLYSGHATHALGDVTSKQLESLLSSKADMSDISSMSQSVSSISADASEALSSTSALRDELASLSSNPYYGAWRIDLLSPQEGTDEATFVGKLMSDNGMNLMFTGTLVETEIPGLQDHEDEQFNVWLVGNYLSAVKDGAVLSSGIGHHSLEYGDLYWYHEGSYPRDNMRTFFNRAALHKR